MDAILTALISSLTPQVIFSMLGGLIGALISSDRKRYGWQLSLLFILASLFFAAAVGEYLYLNRDISSLWLLVAFNIPLGAIVGATLDIIRVAYPSLIERLVVSVGNNGINILVESIIVKICLILGVKPRISKPTLMEDVENRNKSNRQSEDTGDSS